MGQELTSPIKCSGDENLRQERETEKKISNRESGLLHKYKRSESPQRSQNSILTLKQILQSIKVNPDEHSPEQTKRSSNQASISQRQLEQSNNSINKSPVRTNKFYQEDDNEYSEQIKKSKPIITNGQYPSVKIDYSPNRSSLKKNQNKNLSPLDRMLDELEEKKKQNQELVDIGYPRGSSPSKQQMIRELLAPQYEEQNKIKRERKKTPEQVDQLVKKLLQKGEEIKLKQQQLQEDIQNKEQQFYIIANQLIQKVAVNNLSKQIRITQILNKTKDQKII